MTNRGLVLIWCAVITSVTLVVVAMAALTNDEVASFDNIPAVPVIAIGSSLMKHAVPPLGSGTGSLLGDGRAHARLAINGITEGQTVALLKHVLSNGAKTVLIEASALAFDSVSRTPTPNQGIISPDVLMKPFLDLSARVRWYLGAFIRQQPRFTQEVKKLDADFSAKPAEVAKNYLRLRSPAHPEALEVAISIAAANGVDLILIAPPRSQLFANVTGPEATEALHLHFQTIAHQLNLPIFQPSAVWSNEYFIDAGHMNGRGRARFLDELAQWWARRP